MFIIFIITSLIVSLSIFLIKNNKATNILSTGFLLVLVLISGHAYLHIDETENVFFKYDSLGVLLSAVLTVLSAATFYYSRLYLKRNDYSAKQISNYYSALIMLLTAILTAYFSENIAVLWVSIETTSLFVSILIFFEKTKNALEAAWKYLFVSSIGIALAFVGILFMSIVVSDNGLTDLSFETLTTVAGSMNPLWLKLSFLLILSGFSVKLSVFPLYAVAVDAKTIAPSPINAIMSTALVNVGFVSIFRTFAVIAHSGILQWAQNVLLITGIVSLFITSIQLMRVKRLKRAYAFSSMEHMGLVCLGLAVGGIGYYAVILHVVLHSFAKAGLFYQINQIHSIFSSKWVKDFSGYFKINPVAGLSMIIGFISIGAIPPSGLFVSEFLIFKALFLNHQYFLASVALILLTVILYILAKIVLQVLFGSVPEKIDPTAIRKNDSIIQFALFALVIYLGINPPVFFTDLIHAAISVLN